MLLKRSIILQQKEIEKLQELENKDQLLTRTNEEFRQQLQQKDQEIAEKDQVIHELSQKLDEKCQEQVQRQTRGKFNSCRC